MVREQSICSRVHCLVMTSKTTHSERDCPIQPKMLHRSTLGNHIVGSPILRIATFPMQTKEQREAAQEAIEQIGQHINQGIPSLRNEIHDMCIQPHTHSSVKTADPIIITRYRRIFISQNVFMQQLPEFAGQSQLCFTSFSCIVWVCLPTMMRSVSDLHAVGNKNDIRCNLLRCDHLASL